MTRNTDYVNRMDDVTRSFATAYLDRALTTGDDDEARRMLAELREVVLRFRHLARAEVADRARR